MKKEDKFIVTDASDIMCIGGFGNLKGNLGLLKYSEEELSKMIIENNNNEDNIRLINSLIRSIRELQNKCNELKDTLNKIQEIERKDKNVRGSN